MNTSEQLKNEAIRKAWIAEIGEEAFELLHSQIRHEDGGLSVIGEFDLIKQTREILGEKLQETDKFKFDGRNLYLVALSGIESNNGWIRIEPDGSNLPDKIIDCWCIKDRLMFYPLLWRKDLMQFQTTDASYYDWQEFTHYQRIVEPQPPIY